MKEYRLEKRNAILRYHDLPGEGTPIIFIHGLGCAAYHEQDYFNFGHLMTIITATATTTTIKTPGRIFPLAFRVESSRYSDSTALM